VAQRITPELLALAVADHRFPLPVPIARELQHGMRAWLLSDGRIPLERLVGLPSTPARARRALRDHYLCCAGELFDGTPWRRAVALCSAANLFERRRWPCWQGLTELPNHAEPVDAFLWRAAQMADGPLPGTPQAFALILSAKQME
jgi:hypothetical protein